MGDLSLEGWEMAQIAKTGPLDHLTPNVKRRLQQFASN